MADFDNENSNVGIYDVKNPTRAMEYRMRYHYVFTYDGLPRAVVVEYRTEAALGNGGNTSYYKQVGIGEIILPSDVPSSFPGLLAAIARAKKEHAVA